MSKYLFCVPVFFLVISCSQPVMVKRTVASIGNKGKKPCAVKCVVGASERGFFHVKSIKIKYFSQPSDMATGQLSSDHLNVLQDYCKEFKEHQQTALKREMSVFVLTQKAPVYHGQLIKMQSSGYIELEKPSYFANVNNLCKK